MSTRNPLIQSSVDTPFYKKSDLTAVRIVAKDPKYKTDKEKKIIKKIKHQFQLKTPVSTELKKISGQPDSIEDLTTYRSEMSLDINQPSMVAS